MPRTSVDCKEQGCVYFGEFYKLIKQGDDSFTPNFELPADKQCLHPDIRPKNQKAGDTPGVSINSIFKCPNEDIIPTI